MSDAQFHEVIDLVKMIAGGVGMLGFVWILMRNC